GKLSTSSTPILWARHSSMKSAVSGRNNMGPMQGFLFFDRPGRKRRHLVPLSQNRRLRTDRATEILPAGRLELQPRQREPDSFHGVVAMMLTPPPSPAPSPTPVPTPAPLATSPAVKSTASPFGVVSLIKPLLFPIEFPVPLTFTEKPRGRPRAQRSRPTLSSPV